MKHTKKRIWALILCLTMLISLIPTYGVEVKAGEREGTFSHKVTFDAGKFGEYGKFENGDRYLYETVVGTTVSANYVSGNCISGNEVIVNGSGYGGKVTKPKDPIPYSSSEYQFDGWYYDKKDYTTDKECWNFETDNVIGNITLYARWKKSMQIYCVELGYDDTKFVTGDNINKKNGLIWHSSDYKNLYCKTDANNSNQYLQSSVIEALEKMEREDPGKYQVVEFTQNYVDGSKSWTLLAGSLTEYIKGLDEKNIYWSKSQNSDGVHKEIYLVSSQIKKGIKKPPQYTGYVTSFTYEDKTIYRTFHDDMFVFAGYGFVREADEILSAFGINDTAVNVSCANDNFHFESGEPTNIYVWKDFASDTLTITGKSGQTYSFACQSLKMLDNTQALVNVSAGNEILVATGEQQVFGDILEKNGVPHAGDCVTLQDALPADENIVQIVTGKDDWGDDVPNMVKGVSAGTTTITGTVGTDGCTYWNYTGPAQVTIYVKVVDKVSFDLNGGTGDDAPDWVLPGYITMPDTYAKFPLGSSNADFKGWSKNPYADTPEYEAGKPYNVTSGTLYAIYDVSGAKKELTFISDGKTVSSKQVLPGQPVVAPEGITKEGYVLEGWYTDAALTNKYDFETEKMPEENLTLYAKWVKELKAVIDYNDGTEPTTIGQLKATGTIPAPADPTREGYVFDGWYCDKDFKTECDFDKTVGELTGEDGVITIYAKWLRIYKAVIDYNYDAKKDTIERLFAESQIPVPDPAPTREGYTFGGWYYDQAFTRTWNFDDAIGNFVDENGVITIYAKWIEKAYEISGRVYESDGTTGVDGAAVKLMKGNREYTNTTTSDEGDNKGKYSFTGIGEGIYNIVVTKDEKVVTKLVEITSEDLTGIDVILPEKVLQSVVETNNADGEVTPDVMVGGLDELAGGAVGESDSGAKVSMIVEAKKDLTKESEDSLSEEQKQIQKQQKLIQDGPAKTKDKLQFIDMEIHKQVRNGNAWDEPTKIEDTEAAQGMVLTIIIPYDMEGKYNLTIFRYHGDKAEKFTKLSAKAAQGTEKDGTFYLDKGNKFIYVYASKFSTYAIGYDETESTPSSGNNYYGGGISVTGVTIRTDKDTLTKAGETAQLKAVITPEYATNSKVTWKSEDEKVVTVDANGVVTAVGEGTAKVVVTTDDGKKTAEILITVKLDENKPSEGNDTETGDTETEDTETGDTETGDTETGGTEVVKPSIDIAKNNMLLNSGFKVSVSSKELAVSWAKVDGAVGYVVYAEYCGSKVMDKIKVIKNADKTSCKITKINGKALNTKKPYKVYVVAYKVENGKKVRIAKSLTAHVVGVKNATYTNAKSIKLAKTKVQLAVGKTSQIKAATVLVDKKKKLLEDSHTKEFRYASSDQSVVTVTSGGKIKAVGKGKCNVYVYARNGYAKKVTVTVK